MVRVLAPLELVVLDIGETLSQLPTDTEVAKLMLTALTLVVVMLTMVEAWPFAAAVRLTIVAEALMVPPPPPPPPPPPEASKVTVIGTGVVLTPAGPVGVSVTLADTPLVNPAALLPERPNLMLGVGVVVVPLGSTTSQFLPEGLPFG